MGLTMFLLGIVLVAFVAALIGILSYAHASNGAIIFLAVVFALGMSVGSYFFSDKIALSAARAREVSPQDAPELHGIVDRLCALADMPKPRVAIAESDMPNAFATGRNSKVAVLCVTTGLLRRLTRSRRPPGRAHDRSGHGRGPARRRRRRCHRAQRVG